MIFGFLLEEELWYLVMDFLGKGCVVVGLMVCILDCVEGNLLFIEELVRVVGNLILKGELFEFLYVLL